MTINNILNEMASKDIIEINTTDSVEAIANKYIENYKKRTNKEFSKVAASRAKSTISTIIKDDAKLIEVILLLKSKAGASNPTGSNAQPRVSKGTKVENFLLTNTKNIIEKHGSIGPLTIDGKSLKDILDLPIEELNTWSIPKKCSISISFAKKIDAIVNDTTWKWNDGSPVKDISNRKASSLTVPIYIESKAGANIVKVSGTMAFELGKVSTYEGAYKILTNLKLIPFNSQEARLVKSKPVPLLTPQEFLDKKRLQEKILHMLSGKTMQEDMSIAKRLFDKIVENGKVEKVLNENIKTLKNHFIIISNLAELQNHKVTSLTCMADNSISLVTTKGWKGFYKLNGNLNIKEEFIDNNFSAFMEEFKLQKPLPLANKNGKIENKTLGTSQKEGSIITMTLSFSFLTDLIPIGNK